MQITHAVSNLRSVGMIFIALAHVIVNYTRPPFYLLGGLGTRLTCVHALSGCTMQNLEGCRATNHRDVALCVLQMSDLADQVTGTVKRWCWYSLSFACWKFSTRETSQEEVVCSVSIPPVLATPSD